MGLLLKRVLFVGLESDTVEYSEVGRSNKLNLFVVPSALEAIGYLHENSFDLVAIFPSISGLPISSSVSMLQKKMGNSRLVLVDLENHNNPLVETITGKELYQLLSTNSQDDKIHIDLSRIEELANGDQNFVDDMLKMYVEDFPGYISSLSEAAEIHDWTSVGKAAHKVKAPLNMVGVLELNSKLITLDDVGQDLTLLENHRIEDLMADVEKILSVCIEVRTQLNSMVT